MPAEQESSTWSLEAQFSSFLLQAIWPLRAEYLTTHFLRLL
jgi:hypothetical protein